MDLIDRAELLKDYTQTFVVGHGVKSAETFQGVVKQAQKVDAIPLRVIEEIKAKIDFEEKWLMDVWHTDEKTNRRMRIDDIKVAMDGLRHFINQKVKEHET